MTLRRIAYVLRIFPKLSETFIASELAELRRRGVEVRVLSLLPPRSELRHHIIAGEGLDKIVYYNPADFLAVVKDFRPQLLHAHFATEATAAAIELAIEQEIPFTFTVHGYDLHRKAPADLSARAAVARAVVTVSEANAACLTQDFGVPRSHLRVIPCGVDTEQFHPPPGGTSPNGAPLILCVARLVAVKNLGLLLEGCALLRQRGQDFRCVLIGDGPCREELEEARARLGLRDFVEMPGAAEQTEVLDYWQHAAVGVLTSAQEGMPVSLMEAAACGVPVVATAVGGVPELLQDGVTGVLTPPGNAAALATALERLLRDGELRKQLGSAARRRAKELFSVARQVDQLVRLWSEILAKGATTPVFVSDPFNAGTDPELPTLALALDPLKAKEELRRRLPRVAGKKDQVRLIAIRILRHKPGRRAVVEYDLRVQRAQRPEESVEIIGKVRARRFGKEGFRLLERLWHAGFDSSSADGISVPEPLGVVPHFQMWFQEKVPGETATRLLVAPDGVGLARRIAEAIHKVHRAGVPTSRRHTIADELRILHECLATVSAAHEVLRQRLARVLAACDRLGGTVPEPAARGIHRDFYPAQVVVNRERIYLIDFDLYCMGDPGLDIGNFIGHMIEQSLRESGDAQARAKPQEALEEHFISLAGEQCRGSISAYTTLTLVRHIYLSTRFEDRQSVTGKLLELCERRLGLEP